MDTLTLVEGYVQTIAKLFPGLYVHRYLSAFAVAVSLWDHCITLDEEYWAVWVNRDEKTLWTLAYLVFRYGSDTVLMFTAYALSGTTNVSMGGLEIHLHSRADLYCLQVSGLLLVAYRIHTLWEHRRFIRVIVYTTFSIFIITSAILLGLGGAENARNVIAGTSPVRSCIFSKKARLTAWGIGTMAIFDLFLVLMSIVNALDMPRTRNTEVLGRLNREGAKSFLLYYLLHYVLLFGVVSPSVTCFSPVTRPGWAFSSIITSRLFCRVSMTEPKQGNTKPQPSDSVELEDLDFSDIEKTSCSSSRGVLS
ncbi:hypothetical protein NP233_g8794 [Leucocoprinus birnbaumii]|uniref:Uncharacterized protein n=1 Tax=Leucocoprinus birnbaumii TaxID=56174 RepID=A0AAD5VLN5_9AGAR|nr:hypothetical protein NP233_g8794 [Leucocoprinus birnbaumii]